MLSHQKAKRLANDHLRSGGSTLVAGRATRDRDHDVWLVGYVDPAAPCRRLDGGALLVTDAGAVHDVGSAPGSVAHLMLLLATEHASNVPDHRNREDHSMAHVDRPHPQLPDDWRIHLQEEVAKPYWAELMAFVDQERATHEVYPPEKETFAAFEHTPFDSVRVVILGQDPYPNPGEAHGLCFSVRPGVAIPSSLKNIHKQLARDLGIDPPDHGCLDGWADQGVLLLNTTLTVRRGEEKSHAKSDWKIFTDAVIRAVSAKPDPVVFVLWGNDAKSKRALIDTSRHHVIESSHPSPRSARLGFNTSAPFSEANSFLETRGGTIDWSAFRSSGAGGDT